MIENNFIYIFYCVDIDYRSYLHYNGFKLDFFNIITIFFQNIKEML